MNILPVISLFISAIVAWLIVPPITGFPMIPFFIFFVGLSSLVYFIKKEKPWFDTILYSGIVLISFFTIYRANGFLQFFDFIFIIFFGSLLIRSVGETSGVFNLILSPLIVIRDTLVARNSFPYSFKMSEKFTGKNYVREYIPTIAITALVMIITIPLLASANPFFNVYLQNILHFFNLEWLFRFLFSDSLVVYIIRFVVFLFLIFFIPRAITISTQEEKTSVTKNQFFSINYLAPKTAMAGLLLIFFITQLQIYFASAELLQQMGYTNSRLTNEVFAQVTCVAFIVFLLAYLDKSKNRWNTRLTYILTIEAAFLIGVAFKSVYDYTSLFGFTQKRLWGYTSMIWLTGAFAAFVYHYVKQTSNLRFIKQVIIYTLGVVLLVNVLNFDYLIYHYAKATTPAGIDYQYLTGLSTDAQYYKDALPKIMSEIEKAKSAGDYKKTAPAYNIINNIYMLRNKYDTRKDINTFNFSEYQEYLATKDIDLEAYSQKIPQYFPQPQ